MRTPFLLLASVFVCLGSQGQIAPVTISMHSLSVAVVPPGLGCTGRINFYGRAAVPDDCVPYTETYYPPAGWNNPVASIAAVPPTPPISSGVGTQNNHYGETTSCPGIGSYLSAYNMGFTVALWPGDFIITISAGGTSVDFPYTMAGPGALTATLGDVTIPDSPCSTGSVSVTYTLTEPNCLPQASATLIHDGGAINGTFEAPSTFLFENVPNSETIQCAVTAGGLSDTTDPEPFQAECPPLGGAPTTYAYIPFASIGGIRGTPPPLACGPVQVTVEHIPDNAVTEVVWDASGAEWWAFVPQPGSYRVTITLGALEGCMEEYVVDVDPAPEQCNYTVSVESTIGQVAFGVPSGSAVFSFSASDPEETDPWNIILSNVETGANYSGAAADSEDQITVNGLPAGTFNIAFAYGDCSGSGGSVVIDCVDPHTLYADGDGDGYGWAASSIQACNLRPGYVEDGSDCDDDNSISGAGSYYRMDRDGDGAYVGGDVLFCSDPTDGFVPWQQAPNPGDCNDNDASVSNLIGTLCDDGNPCTMEDKIVGGCACVGIPAPDSDGDGVCDIEDDCPFDIGEEGSACDDGPGTPTAGVLDANCVCVPQTTDCNGVVGGPALPGTACNDNNPLSTGEIWSPSCQCGERLDCLGVMDGVNRPGALCNDDNPTTAIDTWQADCTCVGAPVDCLGAVSGSALPGTACNDGNDATVGDTWLPNCYCQGQLADVDCAGTPGGSALPDTPCDDGELATVNDTWSETCECIGELLDTDDDGIPDGIDGCPGLPGEPGSACDDTDPLTINDVLGNDCVCLGTTCTTAVTLQVNTDGAGADISWTIRDLTADQVVCSANGLPNHAEVATGCCLIADRCYKLIVTDQSGDGMIGGGYHLTMAGTGQRLIDNRDNFRNIGTSAVSTPESFCLPIGAVGLNAGSCDKETWINNEFIVCGTSDAVSSAFVPGAPLQQQADDTGYEFWFFDPNGSYSYRRFVSHRTAEGRPSEGALRVNALRVNGWPAAVAPPLPARMLLNVRVRPRVAGENMPFGAACRFRRAAASSCAIAQLLDAPGDPQNSCDVDRRFWKKSRLYAVPASTGVLGWNTRYMFRFRHASSGQVVTRIQQQSKLVLYWEDDEPLVEGRTYDVDVRISRNAGLTWCGNSGLASYQSWGPVCTVTILPEPREQFNEVTAAVKSTAEMVVYPNPNNGNEVMLSLSAIPDNVNTANVVIHDLLGKQVYSRNVAVQAGIISQRLDLDGTLNTGMYLIQLSVGDQLFTERMVVRE